jgi:pyridoxine 4-dehydrogenase
VMLPIPGTSSVAHLEENVAAAEVSLSDEDFAALSAVSTPAAANSPSLGAISRIFKIRK